MRFLVLHNDYDHFVDWFYRTNPGLEDRPYEEQLKARRESLFGGTSIFYEEHLEALGHEATTIYVRNERLQRAWLKKFHGGPDPNSTADGIEVLSGLRSIAEAMPVPVGRIATRFLPDTLVQPDWIYDVLARQLAHYEPDVVVNKGMFVSAEFLAKRIPADSLLVGTSGLPKHRSKNVDSYDLLVLHMTGLLKHYEDNRTPRAVIRHAFEPRICDLFEQVGDRSIDVSFVGSLSRRHSNRIDLLETLCLETPIEIWAPNIDYVPKNSPIMDRYQGSAWGREMYEVLANSKISVNKHIDSATGIVGNLRLFEATGMGSLLVTDEKPGLRKLFEVGEEVVTYDSPRECAQKVNQYLINQKSRVDVAQAGKRRTHSDHTFQDRMEKFVAEIERVNT
jgi:hypothetical protein